MLLVYSIHTARITSKLLSSLAALDATFGIDVVDSKEKIVDVVVGFQSAPNIAQTKLSVDLSDAVR